MICLYNVLVMVCLNIFLEGSLVYGGMVVLLIIGGFFVRKLRKEG